ncbi:iron ABC transporter permease [Mycoplasma wenyonii]|uniref:Iron ABC transporter permease n=1 Tax=Mycoplasma wenyonii TaxID=65123 RepID=A0A328PQQ8_9MOLU|nr:iron ABC transporter permease [Mycoplasma wenyonii]RAO95218.1 iron ABC transporter permease [Mycoplasma wenyonii]
MSRASSLQIRAQNEPSKWICLALVLLSSSFFALFTFNWEYDFSYKALNPRLWQYFLAIFSGGALGVAGLMLQKLTKNPLADISLLGIGSLNIIAISVFIFLNFDGEKASLPFLKAVLPIISLLASLLGTTIVYLLTKKKKSTQSLVISGIAFQFLCEAISVTILNFISNDQDSSRQIFVEISNYSYGKLPDIATVSLFPEWRITTIVSFLLIAVIAIAIWVFRRDLELMEIGEDYAISQGIKVKKLRLILFGAIALLAGIESALVGTISLLGIIAPHISKFLFGNKASSNVIASFIVGALLVVLATFFSVNLAQNIPIGIFSTAIITPIFLFLLLKNKNL